MANTVQKMKRIKPAAPYYYRYIIHSKHEPGHVKVGYTRNPTAFLSNYETSSRKPSALYMYLKIHKATSTNVAHMLKQHVSGDPTWYKTDKIPFLIAIMTTHGKPLTKKQLKGKKLAKYFC